MGTKHSIIIFLAAVTIAAVAGCGPSYDEVKRQSQAEWQQQRKADSLALKVGVMPTLDCLPIYVAKECNLFDTAKADIRLKPFNAQIDCDAALVKGNIEGCVTDIVRGQHIIKKGTALEYVAATNAYWQLISNRTARIRRINQLSDKMVKIQINDVDLRLKMLFANEMDAMLLPEPQATVARLYKNPVLMDSRDKDMRFSVIAFRKKAVEDKRRRQQLKAFVDGYNAACDSINKNGLKHYSQIIRKYYQIEDKAVNALPKTKFEHAKAPRQKDIDTANEWLK